jgi:hypothetical protein
MSDSSKFGFDASGSAALAASRWAELVHLDEEDVVLIASGSSVDNEIQAHALGCDLCAGRVEDARAILTVEPLERRSSSRRVARVLNRLVAAGAVAPDPRRSARIRVALRGQTVMVLETDTQVRIEPRVAVRGEGGLDVPGVTFFRELGGCEVEVHIVHVPGGAFHLVVGLVGGGAEQRVVLHRGRRELAAEPVRYGAATFKDLKPGEYRVEIQESGVTVGFVTVDVESAVAAGDAE